ncbi:MAG TPA: branched-chain amino acid aminotransferase [Clostridia bacterium]|jgi:branched-chain amino acid aminotransferase
MEIIKTQNPKPKPTGKIKFGTVFTDHMFVAKYSKDKGWHDEKIIPYQPFVLEPSASIFHYGQGVFEGLKAYKNKKGEILMFRPLENFKRMNSSNERMMIPPIDEEKMLQNLVELVRLEKDWIPTGEGESLYIRPAIIANDNCLGVHTAENYIMFIILSPVGAYYAHGLAPVRLYVEEFYVRAAKGGTGHYKFIGNYAASLKASDKAEKLGYDQVLWLDAQYKKYVEEVGSMNIFFVKNGEVITPSLGGSILPGITRMSVIELLRYKGYKVTERLIDIEEVIEGIKSGEITECFGTGTAAVISPVGVIGYEGQDYTIGDGNTGKITMDTYKSLTAIQYGEAPDIFNWVYKVE